MPLGKSLPYTVRPKRAKSASPKSCLVCRDFKHYSVDLDAATKTAGSGCVPCAILVSAADEVEQMRVRQGKPLSYQRHYRGPSLDLRSYNCPTLSFQKNNTTGRFNIFTTSKLCPWEEIKCLGIRSSHSDSREAAELISKWSKACFSSHSKCRQSPTPLPTRIIDVGCLPGDIPRLCSGENKSDPYCALSHCWGSSQPLRTTKATLRERESGIAWHQLPQTFQDAVVVTRRLSIRYLWIDSLCIIQDDELDWQRESARMTFVYGGAYLVISATHAAQGSIGCFSERSPPVLLYTHKTLNNDKIPIYLELDPEIHSCYESSNIYDSKLSPLLPLLSRSWCLQERLLATRVLHFVGEELIWECRSETLCECTVLNLQKGMGSIQGSFVDERHSYELWHKLLKLYMSRQITYPSDRLPAISGIAQQMQRAGLGDYIFGIWKENLFTDLLWTPTPVQSVGRCQAPSWSWACLCDPTTLSYTVQNEEAPESLLDHVNLRQRDSPGLDSEGNPFTTTLIQLPGLHSITNVFATTLRGGLEDLEDLEELEELEGSPAGEDPTHEVTSPALTISAPLIVVSIGLRVTGRFESRALGNTTNTYEGRRRVYRDGLELEFSCDCIGDLAIHDKANGDVVCIWIGTIWPTAKDGIPHPQLMVLRKSTGIGGRAATLGAYERVGIITHADLGVTMGLFKEAKVTEVTIV